MLPAGKLYGVRESHVSGTMTQDENQIGFTVLWVPLVVPPQIRRNMQHHQQLRWVWLNYFERNWITSSPGTLADVSNRSQSWIRGKMHRWHSLHRSARIYSQVGALSPPLPPAIATRTHRAITPAAIFVRDKVESEKLWKNKHLLKRHRLKWNIWNQNIMINP